MKVVRTMPLALPACEQCFESDLGLSFLSIPSQVMTLILVGLDLMKNRAILLGASLSVNRSNQVTKKPLVQLPELTLIPIRLVRFSVGRIMILIMILVPVFVN